MRYIIPYMCILLPWSCSLSNFCFTISSYSPSPSLIDLVLYNSLFKLKKEFPHVRENMLYFPFSFVYLLSTMPYISVSFSNEWQNPMYSLWLNNNINVGACIIFLGFFFPFLFVCFVWSLYLFFAFHDMVSLQLRLSGNSFCTPGWSQIERCTWCCLYWHHIIFFIHLPAYMKLIPYLGSCEPYCHNYGYAVSRVLLRVTSFHTNANTVVEWLNAMFLLLFAVSA